MKKQFIFDRLVDKDNICNFKNEIQTIENRLENHQNIVIFGPRNFGKTSLIKNIILPNFRKKHKKPFIIFADLMGVKNLESIIRRLTTAFEKEVNQVFPIQKLIKGSIEEIKSLKPIIELDTENLSKITLSFEKGTPKPTHSLSKLFDSLKKISKTHQTLLVLDEFQDIAFIPEAEGLLRNEFQQITTFPIVVLGSKKHLLSAMFTQKDRAFSQWGTDLEIYPINYKEYHQYMEERFKEKNIGISFETSTILQDKMNRIPESINLLCFELLHQLKAGSKIHPRDIDNALSHLISSKQSRFEAYLKQFSSTEEKMLTFIAKRESPLKHPTSKEAIINLNTTPKTLSKNITQLENEGIITHSQQGYNIDDPILKHYLRKYR